MVDHYKPGGFKMVFEPNRAVILPELTAHVVAPELASRITREKGCCVQGFSAGKLALRARLKQAQALLNMPDVSTTKAAFATARSWLCCGGPK
jgi:hypothetical protein